MKNILTIILVVYTGIAFSQDFTTKYFEFVKEADSLYKEKDFLKAAMTFTEAFKEAKPIGRLWDHYNAACSWALASVLDSAFSHLEIAAKKAGYSDYNHILNDSDLIALHNDIRWNELLNLIKQNKENEEKYYNWELISQLENIDEDDQKYRIQLEEADNIYGPTSKEVGDIWKIIHEKDSINLIKVIAIIDKYGWLGTDIIGKDGNSTLFLVIQHSDLTTQEKYLPLLRASVKEGKSPAYNLAYLEDRILMGQNKRQIYGTQIMGIPSKNIIFVHPLEDPDNVDKRRAEIGLEPMSDYLKNWDMKWDLEEYKKDLPEYEKELKMK